MKVNKLLRQFSGFSLIEIMVALAILIIAFISLTQVFPFGLSINKEAENSTIASYLAQEKIEELFSLEYDNINLGTIETKHRLADDSASYLYYFQRQTAVSYVDGELNVVGEDMGIKKISVTIYFTNAISKTEKNYNITTLISKR